jgi:5-methyltetrahydrofolate--homocysteine methyltransferase
MSSGLTIRKEILAMLSRKIMLCDGAMGTMLHRLGYKISGDILNLDGKALEDISSIHLSYIMAGADIIQTNTFGANPLKLKRSGNENNLEKINKAGIEAAERAIKKYTTASVLGTPSCCSCTACNPDNVSEKNYRQIFIAGNVGPTGEMLQPYGNAGYDDVVDCFTKQIKILVENGADLILIETMMDLNEAKAAVEAARKVNNDIIVACTLSFNEKGVTLMGNKAEQFGKVLLDLGCDIIGANCSVGSESMIGITGKIREANPYAKILIQPNAGLPKIVNGATVFDESPEVMASNFKKILKFKPDLIGGCCGSTPEHIKKIYGLIN